MELYQSRLTEMHEEYGEYRKENAIADEARYLQAVTTDNMEEVLN